MKKYDRREYILELKSTTSEIIKFVEISITKWLKMITKDNIFFRIWSLLIYEQCWKVWFIRNQLPLFTSFCMEGNNFMTTDTFFCCKHHMDVLFWLLLFYMQCTAWVNLCFEATSFEREKISNNIFKLFLCCD